MPIPTEQELLDAKQDLDSIEALANGSAGDTVVTRLGGTKPSISKAVADAIAVTVATDAQSIPIANGVFTLAPTPIFHGGSGFDLVAYPVRWQLGVYFLKLSTPFIDENGTQVVVTPMNPLPNYLGAPISFIPSAEVGGADIVAIHCTAFNNNKIDNCKVSVVVYDTHL